MADSDTKWFDRALTSNVLGGLVVAVLVWFIPTVISELTKAKVPLWVYVVVATGALLITSVAIPIWRHATWGKIRSFLKWFVAIRPVTAKGRSDLVGSGYAKRQQEIDTARENSKQPRWNVRSDDHLLEDPALHWLRNSGYAVQDVSITTDPAEFVLDGEVFFAGSFGGTTGKNFYGAPTDKGLRDGVTFRVTWWDQNDLQHETSVFAAPNEIWGNQIRAVKLAHEKALQAKDDEIAELRDKITRIAAANDAKSKQGRELVDKILSGPPKPPLPQPRWIVDPAPSGKEDAYLLRNAVPRSVAREVRLESEPGFQVTDAGHWQDLSGTDTDGAVGSFFGVFTSEGETFGVKLTIHWYNEHGKRQSTVLGLRGPGESSHIVNTTLVI